MSEVNGLGWPVTDPAEHWRRWFETGAKAWSGVLESGRENYADPYGLYRQWIAGLETMRERMVAGPQLKAPGGATGMEGQSPVEKATPVPAVNPLANAGLEGAQNLWRQWFEAVSANAQRSVTLGTEMAQMWPRWVEMLEQVRVNLSAVENVPTDPLQFATQWYNATNGPFSDLVADLIEREEFLEQGSRFLQNYASFYKVFKRNSEEYLKNLQLPVRSDITRVAGLVVALEDKIDNLEEAFEDLGDRLGKPATADAVARVGRRIAGLEEKLDEKLDAATASSEESDGATANLEKRLDGVEEKLDRLLAAMESAQVNGGTTSDIAEPALSEAPQEVLLPNGVQAESEEAGVRATAAARRKAEELGVDLAGVEGTGTNGQITAEDVRRKGES